MAIKIKELGNLQITKQVESVLRKNPAITTNAAIKIQALLIRLNEFGANKNYLGAKNYKKFRDGWHELRIKDGTNTWRILFRKIKDSNEYGLAYMFLKQTDAITDAQWKSAKKRANLENWL